jgi:hypothetical protein
MNHQQQRLSTVPSYHTDDESHGADHDPDGAHPHDIETGDNSLPDDVTEARRSKKLSMAALVSFPNSVPFPHPPYYRDKVVGLKDARTLSSARFHRQEFLRKEHESTDTLAGPIRSATIEHKEKLAREGETTNPISILILGNLAAFKVMLFYLVTAETVGTCVLTAGMILYWYNYALEQEDGLRPWTGNGMDFVVLAFAVTSPVS